MKTLALLLFSILWAGSLSAQEWEGTRSKNRDDNFKVKRTQKASYPGGQKKLTTYLWNHIAFTQEALDNYAEGQVTVSFTVEKDSSVSAPRIVNGMKYGINEEVKRLLKKTKWHPARENGHIIRSNHMITVPIRAYKNKHSPKKPEKEKSQ